MTLTVDGRRVEVAEFPGGDPGRRPVVLLHEGLGSVGLWRDLPPQLAEATGRRTIAFSRFGHGRSDPPPIPRTPAFFEYEAETVLPALLEQLGAPEPLLVGHSDGASIALIYAGSGGAAGLRGLILEAPHVFTEPSGLESIARIADIYRTTDLPERLARHHGSNVEVAFWGWNGVWLNPEFRAWNIEEFLPAVEVPILILQGDQDEYGTWKQVEAIQRQAGGTVEAVAIPRCGHAPHREQPDLTLQAMADFVHRLRLGE